MSATASDRGFDALAAEVAAITRAVQRQSSACDAVRARLARSTASAARRRPRPRVWRLAAAGVATLVVVVAAWWQPMPEDEAASFAIDGQRGRPRVALVAGRTPRTAVFSDRSWVRLQPTTTTRVSVLRRDRVELTVDSGRVRVSVNPAGGKRWRVCAGPYRVEVTGTEFIVDWRPSRRVFAIRLIEGQVTVLGPKLGRRIVSGGQALRADATGEIPKTVPEPREPAPTGATAGPGRPATARRHAGRGGARRRHAVRSARRATASTNRPPAPWAVASAGRFAEAIDQAERQGWSPLLRRATPEQLLTLAAAARLVAKPALARRIYRTVRRRFPETVSAGRAAFALGRLLWRAGHRERAGRWFLRTHDELVAAADRGGLAREALGRAIESYRGLDRDRACQLARRYLARFPRGPHGPLARAVTSRGCPPRPEAARR